ncbi:MAG: amino acid adenylation domain-containing protein, partial [Mycoplasmatales bacterium]
MKYELTKVQRTIYNSVKYHGQEIAEIRILVKFSENVEYEKLKDALNKVISQNEILRSKIIEKDGEIYNLIQDEYICNVDYKNVKTQAEFDSLVEQLNHKKIGYEMENLYHLLLIHFNEESYMYFLCSHIIFDGLSVILFSEDLACEYLELDKKERSQYSEFIETEKNYLNSNRRIKDEKYWIADIEENGNIKLLDNRENINRTSKRLSYNVDKKLVEDLNNFTKENNISLFNFIMATMAIYFKEHFRSENFYIGAPFLNRLGRNERNMLGMFVNTLPISIDMRGDITRQELLDRIKHKSFSGLKHQRYCIEDIYTLLSEQFDIKDRLFDITLNYQNFNADIAHYEEAYYLKTKKQLSTLDLNVADRLNQGIVTIEFDYLEAVFSEPEIHKMYEYMTEIMRNILKSAESTKISSISMISKAEERYILEELSKGPIVNYDCKTMVQLFEEQVMQTPDNIALVFGDKTITYRELNTKINKLARKIRALGVKRDEAVALYISRSIEMIIGMFATLKSGGCYLPITKDQPLDRVKYILQDSEAKVILLDQDLAIDNDNVIALNVNDEKNYDANGENLERVNSPGDIAYIIYTSGTTGNPKGVEVQHKGVMNLREMNLMHFDITPEDKILQFSNYAFDASIWELVLSIFVGGELHLITEEQTKDIKFLEEYLKENITISMMPPILSTQLNFENMKILCTSGAEFKVEMLQRCKNIDIILNTYGPTETTVNTVGYVVDKAFNRTNVPIGKPFINTGGYILNGDKVCGVGIIGEFCASGVGIARGYRNRPELTAEKFVDNPFGEGKLYRTGDLARWLADGNIEYLGRSDQQVQIRSFRVELEEVENSIRKLDKIIDAAVIARKLNGEDTLYAYYVSDENVANSEITNKLESILPHYMIPQFLMQLDAIPMTRNLKLDKDKLPEIVAKSEVEYIEASTKNEKILVEIIKNILNVTQVGVNDNIFQLGGDSIKAIRITSELRNNGYNLSVKDIMQKKVVKEIALCISTTLSIETYEQTEIVGEFKLSPIQKYFFSEKIVNKNFYNQSLFLQIDDENFSLEYFKNSINDIIKHHDIFRATYKNLKQDISKFEKNLHFSCETFDFSSLAKNVDLNEQLNEHNLQLNSNFDLENGPLMKINIYKINDVFHILIVVHHLVIDGVSWRIFIEDLNNLYTAKVQAKAYKLPLKTISYGKWVEYIEEYSNEKHVKNEYKYWNELVKQSEEIVLFDNNTKEKSFAREKVQLDNEITKELTTKSNIKYGTDINDLLLSSLACAIYKWKGLENVPILLEGHGREQIHKDYIADRTIGWFTSIFPVILSYQATIQDTIISNKEIIRRIPNKGIGYNILKYLDNKELNENIDIVFNFLGDFTNENSKNNIFKRSIYSDEIMTDEVNKHNNLIINSIIEDHKLVFLIDYNTKLISKSEIKQLMKNLKTAIVNIVKECLKDQEIIKTPSDYDALFLSNQEFKLIQAKSKPDNIEKIMKLTSLQMGMLHHNLMGSKSQDFIQTVFEMEGKVDVEKIKDALQLLAQKHEVFRSNIIHEQLTEPIQIVYKDYEIDLKYIDETAENNLNEIKDADLNRGFNLENDSLLRLTVVRNGQKKAKIIWSTHHIIIDGWSLSIVFNDFLNFYNMRLDGLSKTEISSELATQVNTYNFSNYKEWMAKQDITTGLDKFSEYLTEYDNIVNIDNFSHQNRNIAKDDLEILNRKSLIISNEIKTKIENLTKTLNITLSTYLETAWGVLLQRFTHLDDVAFGKVVSGRNIEETGIEETVGLFINTIPLRVTAKQDTTIKDLLLENYKKSLELSEYEWISLINIIEEIPAIKTLNTLFVFENYYFDKSNVDKEENVKINYSHTDENTGYPITITVFNEEQLELKIATTQNYDEQTTQLLLNFYEHVLIEMLNEENFVSDINTADLYVQVENFNNTEKDYNNVKTLVEIFEEQVEKTPNNIAVEFEDEQLTYKELNARANKLARKLREVGANVDEPIALIVNRSLEMIVSIYAVIKAGSCYLPIDPNAPIERINYILEDSEAKIVLVETENGQLNSTVTQIDVTAEA